MRGLSSTHSTTYRRRFHRNHLDGAQALHLLANVHGALAVPVAARGEGGLGFLQVQDAVLHELLGVGRRVHEEVVELVDW